MNTLNHLRPSLIVSTLVVFILAGLWGMVRLFVFREEVLPLTFVLPLLVCVWTGRRWQLWSMAGVFAAMAFVKVFLLLPARAIPRAEDLLYFGTTLFNIFLGAIVVQAILKLRENLEKQNATVRAQNAELEAQSEELLQQNEEIKAQSEELSEQNEEIEAQSEEVTRQNEDLTEFNKRLSSREEILQGLLLASRQVNSITDTLEELCQRALAVIGTPATGVAILERNGESLRLLTQTRLKDESQLPALWALKNTIAEVVLAEKRTAYVYDFAQPSDFAPLFGQNPAFKSLLLTPVILPQANSGLLAAFSTGRAHWTEEQFRIIEWVAAQCGLVMETLRNQKELAEHARALEAANQSKDNFLAMLSHELRTPLTPVLAVSGLLETDDRLPEEVREDFRMIRRNVGIQSKLIDDLLDLTRISRGKIELNRESLPVASLLADTAQIVDADLGAKSQRLAFEISPLEHYSVLGDRARLQQVFWNLFKNAIKFSEAGKVITVRGKADLNDVLIEVLDQGCGISVADLDRIFKPFEQIRNANKNAQSGLGLGLAIAKSVVELHGGGISAFSEGEGKGATFKIRLPATRKPATSPMVQPPDKVSGPAAPVQLDTRILLVEDHGDTGRTMARLLQRAGYQVLHAESAGAALKLFNEHAFDLVISDLGLPDESGLALLARLRKLRAGLRAICLSGYGMEDNIEASKKAGFSEHLTKPVEIGLLKAAISRTLAHP